MNTGTTMRRSKAAPDAAPASPDYQEDRTAVSAATMFDGAQACLTMLRKIERLPIVQVALRPDLADEDGPDDGWRFDYATTDRLLAEALSQHGTNPGFRMALANFILGELQGGSMNLEMWDPQDLLTDVGSRDMLTTTINTHRPACGDSPGL